MPGSYFNPVGKGPPDPYEKYRTEKIEKDRKFKDSIPDAKENGKHSFLVGYLILLFKRLFDLFEKKTQKSTALSAEGSLREHLSDLKELLNALKRENLSQNTGFLKRLSKTWTNLLEDALRFRKGSNFEKKIHSLLTSIQHFPEKQEHSLGYYLSEYAGQQWIPFPYMEMIQQLFQEHLDTPLKSRLSQWSEMIDSMLQALDEQK